MMKLLKSLTVLQTNFWAWDVFFSLKLPKRFSGIKCSEEVVPKKLKRGLFRHKRALFKRKKTRKAKGGNFR